MLLASSESYVESISGKIKKGDSCTVVDDKFLHMPLEQWNKLQNLSVNNIITFELRQDTSIYYHNKPFTCTLNISIKYFTSRDQLTPKEINNVSLVVKYDTATGKFYPIESKYKFKNAYKVTVVVNSIESKEWGDKLPAVFRIKNEILVERKYNFDPVPKAPVLLQSHTDAGGAGINDAMAFADDKFFTNPPQQENALQFNLQTIDNKMSISWPNSGSTYDEYDIEWTYVDKQSNRGNQITTTYGGTSGTISIPQNIEEGWMRNDNTRVTVKTFPYTVNLPYTDGYVLVRVRGASYQAGNNLRVVTTWQYQDNIGNTAAAVIDAHEPYLNWQYTGTFAEEGKHKEVVSYYDAMLHNRQTVTINNTDNVAVVGENVYDMMGRSTAAILPAPIKDSKLKFYGAVNTNFANSPYSYTDIKGTCAASADPLNPATGTAQYYSPNNSFINDPAYNNYYFTKNVPDAGGFPLAVTNYTADNTGRVRSQGGVGKAFQIGTGHETKYFYGKPMQEELDRMFGQEVGSASHYLKNMVIDPNGQASVSYIDANGKTIATALAGNAPNTMDKLPSATDGTAVTRLNQQLIKSADFSRDASGYAMQSTSTFLAAMSGTFTLHYSVNPAALIGTQAASGFCSNCYYDVTVAVTDACGTPIASSTSSPFLINDAACHSGASVSTQDLSLTIPQPGEYNVSYTLKLSKDAIKWQEDYFITNNKELQQFPSFLQDKLNALDFTACYSECTTCKEKLGSLEDFTKNVRDLLTKLSAPENVTVDVNGTTITTWITTTYNDLLTKCNAAAPTCTALESPCEIKLDAMKLDVEPGGQYALTSYDQPSDTYTYLERNINVLRFYNDPTFTDITFTDDDGNTIHIKDLSESDFIKAYLKHLEWADQFVVKHIEYCSYQWCTSHSDIYTFDQTINEVVATAQDAANRGFFDLNSINAHLLLNVDPFFNGGIGSSYKTSMLNDLDNFSVSLNFNNGSGLSVKNILQFIDWALYCKPTDPAASGQDFTDSWNNCAPSIACRSLNSEWNLFKQYYLQLKSKYEALVKNTNNPNCTNCYVGKDLFASGTAPDCIPGNPSDYTIVRTEGGNPVYTTYTLYYKYGTQPFPSNNIITYQNNPDSGTPTVSTIQVTQGANSAIISYTPGLFVALGGYTVTAVNCPASPLATCVAANSSNGTSECPATLNFGIQRNYTYVNDIYGVDFTSINEEYDATLVVYSPITRPVNINLFSITGYATSDYTQDQYTTNLGTITLRPGDNNIPVGHGHAYWYVDAQVGRYYNYDTYDIGATYMGCPPYNPAPASSCTSDPNYAYYKNKTRIFNDYVNTDIAASCMAASYSINNQADADAATAQSIVNGRAAITSKLSALRDNWINTLKGVRDEEFSSLATTTLTDAVINNIANGLYAVAQQYIQIAPQNDIRPASTLPSGMTVNGYNSFKDVFTALVGTTLMSQGFNQYLLSQPYPYDKQLYDKLASVSEVSSTICANVTALQNSYTASGSSLTFSNYLKQLLSDDYVLTSTQLADLQSKCATGCVHKVLNDPLLLPIAFVTPNAPVSCANVDAMLAQFKNDYQVFNTSSYSLVPGNSTKLFRVLFTNYANQNFGYSLSFDEYTAFKTTCATTGTAVLYNKSASPLITQDNFLCAATLIGSAFTAAGIEYDRYIKLQRELFRNSYVSTCLNTTASANIEGDQYEYHYTLYYYDQSGNLVKTIPPEGVKLLTAVQIAQVEQFKNDNPNNCTGIGIPASEDRTGTFNGFSANLQNNTAKAVEMWLYSNNGSSERQVRFTTPDNKYLYQAAVKNNKLWVELYSLLPGTGGDISIVQSAQAYADISAYTQPLQNWSHVMLQSSGAFGDGADMQLYFDGHKLTTLTTGASIPTYPYDWEIDAGFTLPATDVAALKHFRVYNRTVSDNEVYANYANSCLSPVNILANWNYYNPGDLQNYPLAVWGRFNVPAPGSETTINGGTTEWAGRWIVPDHVLPTYYAYNSLNQVVLQNTPDAGTAQFWYDRLGRLAVSQNAEQLSPVTVNAGNPANRFSYTVYDALSRITEVGEKISGGTVNEAVIRDVNGLAGWLNTGSNRQATVTAYDDAPTWAPGYNTSNAIVQANLRKRVAATALLSVGSDPAQNRLAASYYNYDIDGNVQSLVQENVAQKVTEQSLISGSNGLKKIDYEYDLISGKVNKVKYQDGKWDQFYYQYLYDAENRLTDVYTSRNNYGVYGNITEWKKDAHYRYYLHGPLARTELGSDNNQVQGLDYVYTLQGWLKGVNSRFLGAGTDIGADGYAIGAFNNFGRDALAYSLGYYQYKDDNNAITDDYTSITGNTAFANTYAYPDDRTPTSETGNRLFNGNISHTTYAIAGINAGNTTEYTYRYDQLNRLTAMDAHSGIVVANPNWNNGSIIQAYREQISYDANGNIKTYLRNGAQGHEQMDNLTYAYNVDYNGRLVNNKLRHVNDAVGNTNQGDLGNQPTDNYSYDNIGNLTADNSEQVSNINWTVYGKIASLQNSSGTINYSYNTSGNRITKTVSNNTTYYVRDAQGNTMGVYTLNGSQYNWAEQHLYGSSRLGMVTPNYSASSDVYTGQNDHTEDAGNRMYELTNHLGNVLATITNRRIAVSLDGSTVDHYNAEIISASDYYPFGMQMPGRNVSSSTYRYGFNGKENDNEVKGTGNQQDYGMRIYDPRVGKFLSEDPLTSKYPSWTPYTFAMDRPIDGIDLDGLEWQPFDKNKKTVSPEDRENISGYRWVGYDQDKNGNFIPKSGTVQRGYTFGVDGMTTFTTKEIDLPSYKGVVPTTLKIFIPERLWTSYDNLSTGDPSTDAKLNTLHSSVKNKMKHFILESKYRFDINLRVTDGYRTYAQQDAIYAKGRTTNGQIVTNAKGGESNHNFGLAIDIVPIERDAHGNVTLSWESTQYPLLGRVGQKSLLEWGGSWKKIVDQPHFQDLQGKTLKQLRALPKDVNGLPIFNNNQ